MYSIFLSFDSALGLKFGGIDLRQRILCVIFSALLVAGLVPTPAFALEESENSQRQGQDSASLMDDGRGSANGSDSGSADQLQRQGEEGSDGQLQGDGLSLVEYVYIESPTVAVGSTQNIVVGLCDDSATPASATLHLAFTTSGEEASVPMERSVGGAILFSVDTSSLAEGEYELRSLEYDSGSSIETLVFSDDEIEYTFIVSSETSVEGASGSDESPSAGDASGEPSDTSVITMDDQGETVELDSIEDAIDEASDASGIAPLSADGSAEGRSAKSSTLTVVLDPGHGGYDPGAMGNGIEEADVNLKIAQYCRDELSQYKNVRVLMTRESDVYVSLSDRVDYAVNNGADLVVGIHNNSSTSSDARGSEVIIPRAGEYHEIGEDLGNRILDELESLGLERRSVYSKDCTNGEYYSDGTLADYYTMISGPREYGITGIIIEHAFVSNWGDANFLGNDWNLKNLGISDATAIANYYGLSKYEALYGFTDVFENTAHYEDIGWLASSGISEGFPDGSFRPMSSVARQDMAAFLYRLAGSPDYEPSAADERRFSDVDPSTPHYREILWLGSTGISEGFPDGTFRGMSSVARQDMAAFLRRTFDYITGGASEGWEPTSRDKTRFEDIGSSTSHAEDIWWLGASGISTGFPDGTYRGMESVVRQDMAAFLHRLGEAAMTEEASSRSGSNETPAETTVAASYDVSDESASMAQGDADSDASSSKIGNTAAFSDVDENTAHYEDIGWLASSGISEGFPDGTFRGMSSVARQDMAAFLRRTFDYITGGASEGWEPNSSWKRYFKDVDSSTSHSEDIWWLAAMGISKGFSDNSYRGMESVVRQDMAAFLHRLQDCDGVEVPIDDQPIMGGSDTTASQLAAYYRSSGKTYPSDIYKSKGAATIEDFCRIVMEESQAEGVRAEVVFCQAMHETGWLQFGGDVKAEQCNFAGIGATGGVPGATFADVRTGIRAQVQHLKAYASTDPLVNDCVDPRFHLVERGCAPYLSDLSGRWAVGDSYGQKISAMIEELHSLLSVCCVRFVEARVMGSRVFEEGIKGCFAVDEPKLRRTHGGSRGEARRCSA